MSEHSSVSDNHNAISVEKWAAICLLTSLSIIFGLFPFLIFSCYRRVIRTDSILYKTVLSSLSSICGGVLLATTMLHILPEVREKAASLNNVDGFLRVFLGLTASNEPRLPPAEFLMIFGFCLIYGLEEVAQFMLKLKCSCSTNFRRRHKHSSQHAKQKEHFGLGTGYELDMEVSEKKCTQASSGIVMTECQHLELIEPECKSLQFDQPCESCDSPISMTLSHSDSSNSTSCSPNSNLKGSVLTLNHLKEEMATPFGLLRSLVSLLALSFHAVMEGITVGVGKNHADIWMTFGAIASHKCIIALVLGMEMMKSNMNWKTLVASIFMFSIVSPIGIFIGSIMVTGDGNSGWIVVVEGLASGTLLYIIFFEILPPTDVQDSSAESNSLENDTTNYTSGMTSKPRHDKKPKLTIQGLLRFVGTLLGVLLASYLISIFPHVHNSHSSLSHVKETDHSLCDEHDHV